MINERNVKGTVIELSILFFFLFFFSGPGQAFGSEPGNEVGGSLKATDDWLAGAREHIEQSEYQVTWQEKTGAPGLSSAYQAPNRALGLRTYFTENGIRVTPRSSSNADWMWGLRLAGFGSIGNLEAVEPVAASVNGKRVEYRRAGLSEWYVNDSRGLEQGFTLHSPPLSGDGMIALAVEVSGNLEGSLNPSSKRIEFVSPGGVAVIHFGELKAFDADGKSLPSEFEMTENGFSILVDAAGARYPITVDPLATSPDWTVESNQESASLSSGTAGDVNGDGYSDVIVGAAKYDNGQIDEGRVFVYYGAPTGLSSSWGWSADNDRESSNFGSSVGTAGDVNGDGYSDIVVAASLYDNGETDEGAVFVYHGSASGPSESPDWFTQGDQENAWYGVSAGTAGDVNGDGYSDLLVGAYEYDNGEMDEGRAFLFLGSENGLSTNPAWTDEGDQEGARFGISVGTAGDVNGDGFADIIVGAEKYDNGQIDEGGVFVYHGSASGLSPTPDWFGECNQASAQFGESVGTAGDVNGDGFADVVVGARYYSNPENWEGAAFVYYGSETGLSSSPAWDVESNQETARLGMSVGTAGDVNGDGCADIVVGAYCYDNGQADEGRAFVYLGSANGLPSSPNWTAESDQADAHFGIRVGTAGDVNGDGYSDVVISAPHYDNGQTDEGRAYVYYGGPSTLSATPAWSKTSDQADSFFGDDVGMAGDVNGDGFSDVFVAAHNYDNGQTDEGVVFVYHGSKNGLGLIPNWSAESDKADAIFGISAGTAGDVNGDGYSDIVVGAYRYNGGVDEYYGRVYVYHGSASGLNTVADWSASGQCSYCNFGASVGNAGDVNGDGFSDIIIAENGYDNGTSLNVGKVYIYYGSSGGLSQNPNWEYEGDTEQAYLGSKVESAGDVNGDGYSDIIIGNARYNNWQGRMFVFHGSSTGLSNTPDWTAYGEEEGAYFSHDVDSAGDIDGDGFSDVIVGAPHQTIGGVANRGRAYAFYGSSNGLNQSPGWTKDGSGLRFAEKVGTAGDVNNDGYSDIILNHVGPVEAYLFLGSSTGLSDSADWSGPNSYLVRTAGDVNGDGYSDVITGWREYNSFYGGTFLYLGNATPGLSLTPQQRQPDDSAPIDHFGLSEKSNRILLSALARTPYGRSQVKLEWEVKPYGTKFDGIGTERSDNWMDTDVLGATIAETAGSLTKGTRYHWRMRMMYHPATTPCQQYSRWFTSPANIFLTSVNSESPEITGQSFLSTNEGVPIEITLDDLTVEDPDSSYPADFTLMVQDSENYTRTNNVITPDCGITGALTVPVEVNDGDFYSPVYDLEITVNPVTVVAAIDGQPPSYTNQTTASLTVYGTNVVVYKYRVNGGTWSAETSAETPIELSGLDGEVIVDVIGGDGICSWQDQGDPSSVSWTVDPPTLALSIAADSICESDGAAATTAIISRNTDTTDKLALNLSSSDPGEAAVPATAEIAAGQDSVVVDIDAVDDDIADGVQPVTITAACDGFGDGVDAVDVTDDETPTLTLSIAADSICESDGAAATTAIITRNTDTTDPLSVNLSSSDPGEAAVPATAEIAAGHQSVIVDIDAVDDDIVDGVQTVTIIAVCDGFGDGADAVDVTDDEVAVLYVEPDKECGAHIPCYRVIQNAVDDADAGAAIRIGAGNYAENIEIDKNVTLILCWDPDFTTMDHSGAVVLAGMDSPFCLTFEHDGYGGIVLCNTGVSYDDHLMGTADTALSAQSIEFAAANAETGVGMQICVDNDPVDAWIVDSDGQVLHRKNASVSISAGDGIYFGFIDGCVNGPFQVKFCDQAIPAAD